MINLQNKYLFIFAISIFFILSISGAGIFLNDEWMIAQELNQLSQGHQISFNEGKYGYYANGTIGEYMQIRDNRLIYPLALPILSLPIYYLFRLLSTFTHIFIILVWGLLGLYSLYYLRIQNILSDKIYTILGFISTLFICGNISISSTFLFNGQFVPYEILPIVFTNIILFGIFSVLCYKISENLFQNTLQHIISWITCIGLSSLIFWCTTLKDHMLIATLLMLLFYVIIYHRNFPIMIFISCIIVWIRPEIGLFVLISILLLNIITLTKSDLPYIHYNILSLAIGLLPLFINNTISTGYFYKNSFLMSNYNVTGGSMTNFVLSNTPQILYSQLTASPGSWLKLIFIPTSGSIGLIVPLIIFFFGILVWIKHRPIIPQHIIFMIYISISSIIYYLIFAGAYLGTDTGIIPDIRYMSIIYAPLTLCGLYIIFNSYKEINYRTLLKNIILCTAISIIISLFAISILPQVGETYRTFRIIPTIFSIVAFAIMSIMLVNDGNTKPKLETIIPFAIASCLSWQIIITFIYHTSKAHYYPMFIPITEFIFKLIFGG